MLICNDSNNVIILPLISFVSTFARFLWRLSDRVNIITQHTSNKCKMFATCAAEVWPRSGRYDFLKVHLLSEVKWDPEKLSERYDITDTLSLFMQRTL